MLSTSIRHVSDRVSNVRANLPKVVNLGNETVIRHLIFPASGFFTFDF